MRKWILLGTVPLALAAPFLFNSYLISILILALYAAYLGQAWNILIGFTGQLSLGHALYTGLGAYITAGFFLHFNLSPWLSMPIAAFISAALGGSIAALGFRFGMRGSYFTLLTIAFAECGRLIFEHWSWFGATGGLFIPITEPSLINLLGSNVLFYYLFLGLLLLAFSICYLLLKTRLGYFFLAVREDEDVASSLGINTTFIKIKALALSAALSSIGGSIYAFYQSSLFPEQAFSMARSIELTMGTIVGGIGTLFGPIIGSLVLIPLGELIGHFAGEAFPPLKHLFYGLTIVVMMLWMPQGLWPALSKKSRGNN